MHQLETTLFLIGGYLHDGFQKLVPKFDQKIFLVYFKANFGKYIFSIY